MPRDARWMAGERRLDGRTAAYRTGARAHRFPHTIHVSDPSGTLRRWGPHPRFHRAYHYWKRHIPTLQREL